MELLPDDIYQNIIAFLSLKDKINARHVSSTFRDNVKPNLLSIYRFENTLKKYWSVELKYSDECGHFGCVGPLRYFYIPYKNDEHRVHSLFHIKQNYDKCIVEGCREKRLGYIYIKLARPSGTSFREGRVISWWYYIKRRVPYCSRCIACWHDPAIL